MSVLTVLSVCDEKLTIMTKLAEQKCTGESGDIGDIAKNVKIAMQKFALHYWHYLHF